MPYMNETQMHVDTDVPEITAVCKKLSNRHELTVCSCASGTLEVSVGYKNLTRT